MMNMMSRDNMMRKLGCSIILICTVIVFFVANISTVPSILSPDSKNKTNVDSSLVMNIRPTSKGQSVQDALLKLGLPLLETNQTAARDCFCPNGRHNWIYYNQYCPSGYRGAGIKDRQNIFRNVLYWADEVCARVAFGCSPKVMLAEKKHACRVPENAAWDDYFVVVRNIKDQQLTLVDGLLEYVPVLDESKFDGMTTIDTTQDSHGKRDNPDWEQGTTALNAYKQAQELYAKNETFVWRFGVSFWQSDLHIKDFFTKGRYREGVIPHRQYTDDCGILDLYMTKTQIRVAQILLDLMSIEYVEQFVSLHLRRGDYKKCDTTPKMIVDYLKCSIIEDEQHDTTIEHVLAFTNGDAEYRNNMTNAFNEAFSPRKKIIFVDDVVESEAFLDKVGKEEGLPKDIGKRMLEDNCYRWSVLKVIISTSYFHLERGKASCNECDRGGISRDETVVR